MKKTLLGLAMLAAMTGFSAHADVEHPLYQCALTFKAKGGGVQFIVGKFKMQGPGTIRCVDVGGHTEEIPVKVTLGGPKVAANFAIGKFRMSGAATGIGVASGPEALLGNYVALGGRVAVVAGAGASLAVHGGNEALTLNLAVSLEKGAGLQVGFNRLKIEPAE